MKKVCYNLEFDSCKKAKTLKPFVYKGLESFNLLKKCVP